MAQAHLFVDDLDAPVMAEADRHHLDRVLRLRAGEVVTVSDGRGGLRPCAYVAGGGLDPSGDVVCVAAPSPSLGVGFALVKGTKPEWIVQKLTECGVDRILPFVAERSIVRWDEPKAARNLERWRRVAVEAAMQSRRVWLPEVEPVRPFRSVVDSDAGGVWLADAAGVEGPTLADGAQVTVLVGPEGGWSHGERAAGADRFVRFGGSVLRAETAAIAAGVLLNALRDGAVRPADGRVPRS